MNPKNSSPGTNTRVDIDLISFRPSNSSRNQPYNIGETTLRHDALDKTTGAEKFSVDYYGENHLWIGVKRAGVAHAHLKDVDKTEAMKVPGIVDILTHKDVKGTNRQGVVLKDQPVLVDSTVRHCGDPVALVLAEDRETLKRSLKLIKLDLEPLEAVLDPELALSEDARIIHEEHTYGNALLIASHTVGKGDEAFSECDFVVEGSFKTPRQEHAFLETESGWAIEEDGRLVIVCSTQTPFRDRTEVSEALGVPMEKIRIIAPHPGGAFGGKDGVTTQTLLGLAAMRSNGRAVKMWWDREESFIAGTKRHPAIMSYKLGAKNDGSFHCLEAHLTFDTGPYDHLGGVVLALAMEHAGGPYKIPNVRLKGSANYTNNPVSGAFRGFGVTQVTAAMEQIVHMMAEKIGVDPMELREKNAVSRGDKTSSGKTLTRSTGVGSCLNTIGNHPLWKQRDSWKSQAGPLKLRGVGIAALMHGSGYGPIVPDVANAKIRLCRDGKFRIFNGVVDMGQGNASTNAQIAGSILCQGSDQLELVLPDTDLTLPSGSASASRCTYTFGSALIKATEKLKARILQRAADLLMATSESEVALAPGIVRVLKSGVEIPLSRIALYMNESERTSVARFRAPVATERFDVGEDLNMRGFPHELFSFGVHLAMVEVDQLTGEITVHKYLAASDCGKVINPQTYEQQIQGGICQGIGYALTEDFKVDNGEALTRDLATYIVPTSMDLPEIESIPVEIYEESGPYGLKGVGEIATNGPAPAIANAVYDACGVRTMTLPMTAESILLEMTRQKKDT